MGPVAVVVDTNVIFAALVRESGLNRYVVTVFPLFLPFYYPSVMREEIERHIGEIAKKCGCEEPSVRAAFEDVLRGMVLRDPIHNPEAFRTAQGLVRGSL